MKNKPCSLSPLVSFYDEPRPIDWSHHFKSKSPSKSVSEDKPSPLEVEIGFGMGEVLTREALRSPQTHFIGIEQHWERIYKTLCSMTALKSSSSVDHCLGNVRILRIDANIAFQRLFAEQSIDRIYSLFPCPWPKKAHIKNRLFSHDFLKLLNSRLKTNGELDIVTDHYAFFEWVLEEAKETGFKIKTETIRPQFDTKFERKWIGEGQEQFFEISMQKLQHIPVPIKKDVVLKSYSLDHFDIDRFQLDKVTTLRSLGKTDEEDITVVLKDIMYDQKQEAALIYMIISEQEMTQHLRVSIHKGKEKWRICKADGQSFFPTTGIAKALEMVYQAAKASS